MKMTREHYKALEDTIVFWYQNNKERCDKFFANQAFSDKRKAWELYHAAFIPIHKGGDFSLHDALYKYLHDDHIETALMRVYRGLVS